MSSTYNLKYVVFQRLTVILPIVFDMKMVSAYYICCIYTGIQIH